MKTRFLILGLILIFGKISFSRDFNQHDTTKITSKSVLRLKTGLNLSSFFERDDEGIFRGNLIKPGFHLGITSVFQNGVEQVQKRGINKRLNNQTEKFLKSTNSIKQSLDSVVYEVFDELSGAFIGDGKDEFTYDSNGNLSSEIYRNYDETMKKVDYSYDSNGFVTLEIEYILDEITGEWIKDKKIEYTLDSKGNWTLTIQYTWDETTSKWVESIKSENTLDSNGNWTLHISYEWNETTSKWLKISKNENSYDSNGKLTSEIEIRWNETFNIWNGDKIEYIYDLNGNLTLEGFYYWNEEKSMWILNSKNEYTYDSKGYLTMKIYYWQDQTYSKWVEISKSEYTNDSNGYPTLHFSYEWSEIAGKWIQISKAENTYDSNQNLTLIISYNWDETTGKWILNHKNESTYDSKGNSISGISYNYDEPNSKWVESVKWEDGYDSYGNLTFISEYEWDETISNWIGWKDESIYDYNYLATDLFLPHWFQDESMKHKITDVLYYSTNENTGELYIESRGKLFYSEQNITNTENSKQQELKIYPNPASDYLNLGFSEISGFAVMELYNSQGNKVLEKEVFQDNQISIKHLENGLYLFKLNYQNKTETGKILILH